MWYTRIHVGKTRTQIKQNLKMKTSKVGERAQWSRALPALAEDLVSSQFLFGISQPSATLVSEFPTPSSDLHRLLHTVLCVQIHTHTLLHTQIHIEQMNKLKIFITPAVGSMLCRVSQ